MVVVLLHISKSISGVIRETCTIWMAASILGRYISSVYQVIDIIRANTSVKLRDRNAPINVSPRGDGGGDTLGIRPTTH